MASLRVTLAKGIATAGGAGYSPIAPGTCGTVVAIPVAWLLAGVPLWLYAAVAVAVTAVGIRAATVADRAWGTHDSGRIVIDEVAGYLITMLAVPKDNLWLLLAGFVLFRFFDIVKPPPVRAIDRRVGGGAGVMLDDVAAGIYAGAALFAVFVAGRDVLLWW